jgi:hypothetical protein
LTSESDPTIPANIKDGIVWSEIGNVPTDIADGDQVGDVGIECHWTGVRGIYGDRGSEDDGLFCCRDGKIKWINIGFLTGYSGC